MSGTHGRTPLPPIGTIVDGKYRLESVLGTGGFAAVFRARHVGLDKSVAIKLLNARDTSGHFFERFRREAELLARLTHPHIVSVTDFGVDPRDDGLPYLVMELAPGDTLEQLAAAGPLPRAQALPILRAIAGAVDAAHAAGILHGDLKPANVVVAGDADGARSINSIKVIDFGLARLAAVPSADAAAGGAPATSAFSSSPGMTLPAFTPEYGAPELTRGGPLSQATDVYAFGVLAYRLLTGRCPYQGSLDAIVQGHLAETPPLPSMLSADLGADIDAAVLRALAKTADARPATTTQVVDDLERAAARETRQRWRLRETPRRVAMASLIAVAAAAGAAAASSAGVLNRVEHVTLDVRQRLTPPRPPDPRLAVITIDDRFLRSDTTPLADSGQRIGRVLRAAFDRGAAGIAIDLLLPAQWGTTDEFSRLVLERADQLTLAAAWSDAGDIVGVEVLDPLAAAALGPIRSAALFGIVNSTVDADGVTRRARAFYRDVSMGMRSTLAGRLSAVPSGPLPPETVVLKASVDWTQIERHAWDDFERRVAAGERLDGRLLILGASFTGSGDQHRVVTRDGVIDITGLMLQARMTDALLDRQPILPWRGWPIWVSLAGLIAVVSGIVLLAGRPWMGAIASAGAAIAWGTMAAVLWRAGAAVPVAAPAITIVSGTLAAAAIRRSMGQVPR